MLLDRKRSREIAERKQRTKRTLLQTVWLIIATAVAVGVTYFLFTYEIISTGQLYALGLPNAVPEWGIYLGVGFVVLVFIQMIFAIGYLIGSPQGRRKGGTATVESSTYDPSDLSDNY